MSLWVSKSKKWPWAASPVASGAFPRCYSQTVSNRVQLHHLQRPRGIYSWRWEARERISYKAVRRRQSLEPSFYELFLPSEQHVITMTCGIRFSLLLTAAPDELVSKCRWTHLGLGFRLMFPATVNVFNRFTLFCPHRCWRQSGRHPGQPYFHIPALLEHAWSFAVQDEAELAQPMHHILLIR